MTPQTNICTNRISVCLTIAVVLTGLSPLVLSAAATGPQSNSQANGSTQKSEASAEADPKVRDKNEERGLDDAWKTFRPKGMEASFEMPKSPKLRERSFTPVVDEPPIKVHLHSATVQNSEIMFVAGWHDLHTIPRNALEQQEVLDGAVSTAVANMLGSIIEKKKVQLERYPGREITYRIAAGNVLYRVVERVYLVGARQYQFRMLAKTDRYDRAAADRFFDSVQLLDPDNDLPPRPRNRKRR